MLIATIECRCGWLTERVVSSLTLAEAVALEHESAHLRRAYAHDAYVTNVQHAA